MHLLTCIILSPLAAAFLIALLPRNFRFVIRSLALVSTLLSLVFSAALFLRFDAAATGYQFVHAIAWVDSLGLQYKVGVDGINVGLILMSAIVAFAAVCVCHRVVDRVKEFYLLLLMMIAGILGAFASLDLFFLYFFHELALIPTFIMIGIWGRGENRGYAAFNITLYLTAGALIALIGLIGVYVSAPQPTFDIESLTRQFVEQPLAGGTQKVLFAFLLFGFGILVSLWPFHTWAPLGYGAAPAATAMLHAGALKKFGLYSLIRVAIPMLPQGAAAWVDVLAWLCLGNILYVGLVAMKQKDFNQLIGHSSVAHMGFIFLGIASLNVVGVTGAVVIMVAHGLLAALSFAIAAHFQSQAETLEMSQMGGFLKKMPFIGSAFLMAAMAGCGLPGFANFVGEAMALFSSWKSFPTVISFAVWGGLVIGAVYMLRAARQILHGPVPEEMSNVADVGGWWRKTPYALLVVALLVFGLWPRGLTDKIRPSAEKLLGASAQSPLQAKAAGVAAKLAD